jgi:serine protease Do
MPITPRFLGVVHDLMEGREGVYGYQGVLVSTPTPRETREAGLPDGAGARVDGIESDSPASRVDFRNGDIIASVNAHPVQGSDDFVQCIGHTPIDQSAKILVNRAGKPMEIDVAPARRPLPAVAINRQNQRLHWQGVVMGPAPSNWSAGAQAGLIVVGIDEDSPLRKLGIGQGSVITSVAGRPVASIADLQKIVNDLPVDQCVVETARTAGASGN